MAVIFAASSIPDMTSLPGNVSDKTGHFTGYAILGALVVWALAGARAAGLSAGAGLRALAISVAYGASDETHQRFVHGRSPALDDWLADSLGAATAIVLVMVVGNLWRRRRLSAIERAVRS
ncbi:MAG: VanZ family protein [Acidobacteriota bacterium]